MAFTIREGSDKLLSNQILNQIIADIHKIIGTDCSVWSVEGKCLVSTCEDCIEIKEGVEIFSTTEEDESITEQGAFFGIRDNKELNYILAIHETMDNILVTGRLCVCQFEYLIQAYKTRVDKNHFYQRIDILYKDMKQCFLRQYH